MVFGPPGHKQGRGTDPRVAEVLGIDVFRSDVLNLNGLDDRRESQGVLAQAQELMADAVGAEHAFFSTCGSSLSVKTAMCSVAGPGSFGLRAAGAAPKVACAGGRVPACRVKKAALLTKTPSAGGTWPCSTVPGSGRHVRRACRPGNAMRDGPTSPRPEIRAIAGFGHSGPGTYEEHADLFHGISVDFVSSVRVVGHIPKEAQR